MANSGERTYKRGWFVVRVRPGGSREAPDRIIQHGALKGMPYPRARQGESKIERALRDEGYACYFPRMKKDIIHHRTKKRIAKSFPLFTGYIFVSLASMNMDFRTLRELDFVGPVVKVGEVPVPISDQMVASIQEAQSDLQFDDTEEARIHRGERFRNEKDNFAAKFPEGREVRVLAGPLGGFHGHVVDRRGIDRVKAMIAIFGGETPVEFEADQLEPLEIRRKSA
jgi:transcription antitermination factor NusG